MQALAYPGQSDLEISVLSPEGEQWDHAGADLPRLFLCPPRPMHGDRGAGLADLAQPITGSGGQVEGWVQAVRSLRP